MWLDEAVANQIKAQQDKLFEPRSVLPDEKLNDYYRLFRHKFGPEQLASLDGEHLLNSIHDHGNRDSLVYWLEFKNDEEFPNRFGSIAGGSALKFGVYRRRETGAWVTGSPQNQRTISVEEAIEIARKHKAQLLRGVKLLEEFPINATNEAYAQLQKKMDEQAPDVSDTAWGHKYFSLIFPDKLDDFHNVHYQRFHLIKLLQIPVQANGRYSVAGQYLAIARELGMHVNNLTGILNEIHGSPHQYWFVKANYSNSEWQKWEDMRRQNYIGIGWAELGDLSFVQRSQESLTKVKGLMREKYNEMGGYAQEIFSFVTKITQGDLVVAMERNDKILGIGWVTGDYYYEKEAKDCNRRPVEWLYTIPYELAFKEVKGRTVRQIDNYANLVEIERRLLRGSEETEQVSRQSREHKLALTGLPARISNILERKGQVILYGPPGTGKTHWAYQTALQISASNLFQADFGSLSELQRIELLGNEHVAGTVRMCTFHPSYGYEDFMEGYKPQSKDNQLVFEQRPGIFKQLCEDARKNSTRKYFLIIDEINRGDIPRIFGELLTILEKDKRGRTLILPLSGQAFSVPPNVFLLGTMNTADRSIALLDTALRRRFGFIELMPETTLFGNTTVESIPLGPWLEALNQRILSSIGRDARNLQVGHAYFLEGGKPIKDFSKFSRILQEDILPLLEEYCYEDYEALERILGKSLIDREKQRIRHELFEQSRRDDLIQALLQPSPEITASLAAVQQDEPEENAEDESEEPG